MIKCENTAPITVEHNPTFRIKVDWESVENDELIRLIDHLESIIRKSTIAIYRAEETVTMLTSVMDSCREHLNDCISDEDKLMLIRSTLMGN